jgi:hypothetical protein
LFPKESVINKYGFLYLSKEVLAALGFQKGDKVILRQTPEGLLISKGVQGGEIQNGQESHNSDITCGGKRR